MLFFEIDSPVAGQNGFLVDDFAAMIIGAHAEVHVIIEGVGREDAFPVGEPDVPFKVDELFTHQVFHVVRVDIDGVVVIDMDIAEAFDIIFMGVHAKAVAEDQGRFLLDLDMVDEGGDGRSRNPPLRSGRSRR